jgi:hypothetical protein
MDSQKAAANSAALREPHEGAYAKRLFVGGHATAEFGSAGARDVVLAVIQAVNCRVGSGLETK